MRRNLLPALVLLALGAPTGAQASVFISEIAWMGTEESGTCEWIELYNSGPDTVDLSSWSMRIDNPGSTKTIAFNEAGSVRYSGIASQGFYLLARKSTSCSPPVADTLVDWLGSFGNGISNEGAKITLFAGSEEIDSVNALELGWKDSGVGGKNTSPKKTPQYTGTGWFEADPTPRATNKAPEAPELEEPEEEPTPTEVTVGGTVPMLPVEHPIAKLFISAIPSRIVFAGAETPYDAVVYDSTGKLRRDADVRWSFGDGGSEKGNKARYTYREPGEYTAVARATGSKGGSAVALVSIVVVTSEVVISSVDERGITLMNPSKQLADLSLWKLRAGAKRAFTLPEDMVIAAGKSALLPWSVTGLATSSEATLLYPDGSPVYSVAK